MEEAKLEIMEATHRALQIHGYSELSIQKIAEQSEKGKSLIYYYFENKQELMESFLDYMMDEFKSELTEIEDLDPEKRIERILEKMLEPDEDMWSFRKAIMEMKARTPHEESIASRFREMDRYLERQFREALEDAGFEDAERRADLIVSAVEGGIDRRIISGNREELEQYRRRLMDTLVSRD